MTFINNTEIPASGNSFVSPVSTSLAISLSRALFTAFLAAALNLTCQVQAGAECVDDNPQEDERARSSKPETVREPIQLFNGRDLSGWTSWLVDSGRLDPRGVFDVEDGMIRISGDGFGYLSTAKPYADYHLIVEFRWGTRNWRGRENQARDSGIFLHSVGPEGNSLDGGGAYKAAVECQIMQGAVGDFLLIKGRDFKGLPVPVKLTARVAETRDRDGWVTWDPLGVELTLEQTGRVNWSDKDLEWRDKLDFRGRSDVETPGQGWTRVECRCRGDQIRVVVNGKLVNEITGVHPAAGKILLQCEGSEIFFRRVELQPLDPGA